MARKATDDGAHGKTDAPNALTLADPSAIPEPGMNIPTPDEWHADRKTIVPPVTDYENQLSIGDRVRVLYRSNRSGNVIERTGTVKQLRMHGRDYPLIEDDEPDRVINLPTRRGEAVSLRNTSGQRTTGTTVGALVDVQRISE